MPRSINELTNNFNGRVYIKIQKGGIFCILECFLVGFMILAFTPTPVLKEFKTTDFLIMKKSNEFLMSIMILMSSLIFFLLDNHLPKKFKV